jgi:hypothetical protein
MIPMKITGKITVNAIESGLLTARRISRHAIAKVALTSRGEAAADARLGDGGWNERGGHAAFLLGGVRRLARAEQLDVGLLEAGVVDTEDGQRGLDPADDRLGGRLVVGDPDRPVDVDVGREPEPAELGEQRRPVGRRRPRWSATRAPPSSRRACRSSRSGHGR